MSSQVTAQNEFKKKRKIKKNHRVYKKYATSNNQFLANLLAKEKREYFGEYRFMSPNE